MSAITQRLRRPGGAILGIGAVLFVAELVVLAVLRRLGLATCDPLVVAVSAALLAAMVAGPVYWLMVLPVQREHRMRLAAERRAKELDRLAMTDPLTEVLNRRGILARLLEAMAHAERYRRSLSIAMLDLDGFKAINDENGHAIGDRVLCRVAGTLSESLRASDHLGRVGGDEFLVVLPETDLELARRWAERVRRRFAGAPVATEPVRVSLSLSLGVCDTKSGERLAELLDRVDTALYRAKRKGRSRRAGAVEAIHASEALAPGTPRPRRDW